MRKLNLIIFALLAHGCLTSQNCKGIERKVDKFTNNISIYYMEDAVSYAKFIKGADTSMYLILECIGSTLNFSTEGVIILLSDGTKIEKPTQKIDVKVSDSGAYKYSAFIQLKKSDIARLIKNNITDFKLYIYDEAIDEKQQQINSDGLKCVLAEK